jgi:O-antigen ligase
VLLLALAVLLAPALGVPNELMLQDTLKSIVVAFASIGAALLLFWQTRSVEGGLRWHAVLWLPLLLAAYALGSMAWSHTFLAGVEAIRWFLFALLLWLGLNTLTRERLPWLAAAVHGGALVASLWAALQFWVDLRLFPQGPNPASTFVNRNFFAEFVVCTLPFAALLLARARRSAAVALLAASTGFVIVTILMTGTRAALIALWLQLAVLWPVIAWRYRDQLAIGRWRWGLRALAAGVLLATVVGLGVIPSGNTRILDEGRGTTALERGLKRTASIGPEDPSLGLRRQMWRATLRLIADHPLAGVGAGAWEVQIPRYQADGTQLETDYYPHNEVLQTLAEDGLVGALFLLGLFAWLLRSAWLTWHDRRPEAMEEGAWRAAALASLLVLLVVGNVGFPWRMASTGALFALTLALLAASDARLGFTGRAGAQALRWRSNWATPALAGGIAALALATYITEQAAECERKIVRAAQIALAISASGQPNAPQWTALKREMLQLTREAVAINPHYRKITPIVADELARWGDWKNATWIWESVLQSRPYVVAILTNAARGHAALGDLPGAQQFLARAQAVSPDAPAVKSLEVILASRTGDDRRALEVAKQARARGVVDFDLLQNIFLLGWRTGDSAAAESAMLQRLRDFSESRVEGWAQLGNFYSEVLKDDAKAADAWRQALALATPAQRPGLLAQVPPGLRARVAP